MHSPGFPPLAVAGVATFLAASRARDTARMRGLSTPDAARMQGLNTPDAAEDGGSPLVPSLLKSRPAEDQIEMTYDVLNSGKVSAYISTTGGPDLYFEWVDDYERGWLMQSFARDVG